MNDPKHRLKETDRLTIEITDNAIVKIILKGEHTATPLGFVDWVNGVAEENGVIISIGHRGEIGAFISEETLKQCLKKIDEKGE